MNVTDVFKYCLDQATAVVKQVRQGQFLNITPDADWSVRDLAGHMLYELSWVPDLVEGKSIAEVDRVYDGDLFGETATELSEHWQVAADRAEAAVEEADPEATAHLSYANVSNEEYLQQAAAEQLIHAWDLGKAIGIPIRFNPAVAQAVYGYMIAQEPMMRSSRLFGEAIRVPKTADLQTKLLALFGRRADWHSSGAYALTE